MASIGELCILYGKPSVVVDKRDLDKIHRATEVLREALRARILKSLRQNQDRPVLTQYGADCTPLLTKERYHQRLNGFSVVRGGHSAHEYLIQKLYFQALGDPPLALLEVPMPMASKTAFAHFGARRQLLKSPRELGHRGLVVDFHKYDRAIQAPLARLHAQFMAAWEDQQEELSSEGEAYRLFLTNWFLCEGCFVHDCHNGLKWSVLNFTKDKDTMRSSFIMHEALRHGYDLMVRHAAPWLRSVLDFRDWGTGDVRRFFRALDADEAGRGS